MYGFRRWSILIVLFTTITCTNVLNCCGHRKGFAKNVFSYRAVEGSRGKGYVRGVAGAGAEAGNQEGDMGNIAGVPGGGVADPATRLSWETLAEVRFSERLNQQYKMNFLYPVFGPRLRRLEGKEYIISGYVIPLDVGEGLYAISSNPYSACYFCGKAGPESVVSLKFVKKPGRIPLDKYRTIRGVLQLNDIDPNNFIYILTGVEACESPDPDQ